MKLTVFILASILVFSTCNAPESVQLNSVENEIIANKIDSFMSHCYEAGLFNGCALVAKGNDIVYREAFGYSDIFTGEPMNIESKFDIGSLTKSFTATAVMILQEKGELSYEDKLSAFFPEFPDYAKQITLHHLLVHQSGIKDFHNDLALISENLSDEIILKRLVTEELWFDPGTRSMYSNSGYFLLARIIEKISGMSFGNFLNQNIFRPLKMKNTLINDGENVIISNKAIGKHFAESQDIHQYITGPSGIFITVDDLYKWHLHLCAPKIVSRESINKSFTASKLVDGNETKYGYGWKVNPGQSDTIIEHGGGSFAGYMSYFIHPISCDHTIVLLYNYFLPENFELVLKGISKIIEGEIPMAKKTPAIHKLNKHIIDNGVVNLDEFYSKINADTLNYIPFRELDFIRLSSFYKSRDQLNKSAALLAVYKDEFPNSVILFEELIEIYTKTRSDELLKAAESEKQILEQKLSHIEPFEIQLLNPKTEDYEMNLRVRSGPGSDYDGISVIKPAEEYTVIGKSMNGEWLKLKREGWLYYRIGRVSKEQFNALPFVRHNK